MKGGFYGDARKGGIFEGESSGAVQSPGGLSRPLPGYFQAGALSVSLFHPSSTVHAPFISSDTLSRQGQVHGSFPDGRFMYSEPAERIGSKADSSSSYLPTASSGKFQANAAPQITFKGEKLSFLHPQESMNDLDTHINVEQEMRRMRQIILEQEALFREQVRELHRVHKVQTLLMEEMKKKDSDVLSLRNFSQTPADSAAMNSGRKRSLRSPQFLENKWYNLQTSVVPVEPLKGGAKAAIVEPHGNMSEPHMNLYSGADRKEHLPARRTFDLERPPEEDDEDQVEHREYSTAVRNTIKFMEPSAGSYKLRDEMSLDIGSGRRLTDVEETCMDGSSSVISEERGQDTSQRQMDTEEVPLLSLFAAKPESLAQESTIRHNQVAKPNLLGGPSYLQLGRSDKSSFAVDINSSFEEAEATSKSEGLSLRMENEEKPSSMVSQAHLRWLYQDKSVKMTPSCVEAPRLPLASGSSDAEILKLGSSSLLDRSGSSGYLEGITWLGESQTSGYVPSSGSHPPLLPRQAEEAQTGTEAHRSGLHTGRGLVTAGPGITSFNGGLGGDPGHRDGFTIQPQSSWRELQGSRNGMLLGVPNSNASHVQEVGGFSTFNLHVRGNAIPSSFVPQAAILGPTVSRAAGSAGFSQDLNTGVWYQQRNSYPPYQHYPQHHQLATYHVQGNASLGPWQPSLHGSQVVPSATVAGPGSSVAYSVENLRRSKEEPLGVTRPVGMVGAQHRAFPIVTPPKPPFQKPPKLVLTHDVTTMELKLVTPGECVQRNLQDKSKISEDDVGDSFGAWDGKAGISAEGAVLHDRVQKDRTDTSSSTYQEPGLHYSVLKKTDGPNRIAVPSAKERNGRDFPDNGRCRDQNASVQHSKGPAVRSSAMVESDFGGRREDTKENIVDSKGVSGLAGDMSRGEPEETAINAEGGRVGPPRSYSDVDSFSLKSVSSLKHAIRPAMDGNSLEDSIHEELPSRREQLGVPFDSNNAFVDPREKLESPESSVKRMRLSLGVHGEGGEQSNKHTLYRNLQEESVHSRGCTGDKSEKGSRDIGVSTEFQTTQEVRNQPDCQWTIVPTSDTESESSKLQKVGVHGMEKRNLEDCLDRQIVDMNLEATDGEVYRNAESNDKRETKPGHSKQLSGTSSSSPVLAEKVARHIPHSLGLHQVASHTVEESKGQADSSSTLVSQASETVQGNGRSPGEQKNSSREARLFR